MDIEDSILDRFVSNKHPQSDWSAEERLERFCWFLEAQFGEGLWSPILIPRQFYDAETMGSVGREKLGLADDTEMREENVKTENGTPASGGAFDLSALTTNIPSLSNDSLLLSLTPNERAALKDPAVHTELERLHGLGILVPGFELRLDDRVARLWCEDFEVEGATSNVWKARIAAVVKNAARVLRPLDGMRARVDGKWLC
jgi:cleavage and polyadenylation specificity factor subunit 3